MLQRETFSNWQQVSDTAGVVLERRKDGQRFTNLQKKKPLRMFEFQNNVSHHEDFQYLTR